MNSAIRYRHLMTYFLAKLSVAVKKNKENNSDIKYLNSIVMNRPFFKRIMRQLQVIISIYKFNVLVRERNGTVAKFVLVSQSYISF